MSLRAKFNQTSITPFNNVTILKESGIKILTFVTSQFKAPNTFFCLVSYKILKFSTQPFSFFFLDRKPKEDLSNQKFILLSFQNVFDTQSKITVIEYITVL